MDDSLSSTGRTGRRGLLPIHHSLHLETESESHPDDRSVVCGWLPVRHLLCEGALSRPSGARDISLLCLSSLWRSDFDCGRCRGRGCASGSRLRDRDPARSQTARRTGENQSRSRDRPFHSAGSSAHKPPQLDHFEIAGWNQPADQTGGDYFDWQVLPDGQLAISIGDATGHGIGPALVSALCRAYARASFLIDQKHDRVLEQLNGLLSHDLADDRFVTFAVVFLNPENGEVKVLSAGHGPILWYRRGRNQLQDFEAQGIPLGMIAGMPYEDSKVKSLKAGDMIVLVTDGFYEWENPESEEFGLARLKETIQQARDCSAEEVISRLVKAVKDFSKGTKQKDDLTMVVLKRKKTVAALKNEAGQDEPDAVAVPA
jgi:hypothetical protein